MEAATATILRFSGISLVRPWCLGLANVSIAVVGQRPMYRDLILALRQQFTAVNRIGKYSMALIPLFSTSALLASRWSLLQQR